MSVSDEFREYFTWTFEGTHCAIKQRRNEADWILDLPRGQQVRLSSAALASLKTNLRRLPNSALRSGNGHMARAGFPWTSEDEALLTSAFRNGMPLETIAAQLSRSRYAVELHLVKLGLMTSAPTPPVPPMHHQPVPPR
jgi:hypothetical protein